MTRSGLASTLTKLNLAETRISTRELLGCLAIFPALEDLTVGDHLNRKETQMSVTDELFKQLSRTEEVFVPKLRRLRLWTAAAFTDALLLEMLSKRGAEIPERADNEENATARLEECHVRLLPTFWRELSSEATILRSELSKKVRFSWTSQSRPNQSM